MSDAWQQMGIWGEDFAGEIFSIKRENNLLQVKVGERRALPVLAHQHVV